MSLKVLMICKIYLHFFSYEYSEPPIVAGVSAITKGVQYRLSAPVYRLFSRSIFKFGENLEWSVRIGVDGMMGEVAGSF